MPKAESIVSVCNIFLFLRLDKFFETIDKISYMEETVIIFI